MIPVTALAVPGITAAGAVVYLLARRSVSGAFEALLANSPNLRLTWQGTPPTTRLANARIILSEFTAAGYTPALAAAALVNAQAESGLNHRALAGAVGEDSVGLFQLNASGGGRGMSTAQRQDPVLNTRRIISETVAAWNARDGGVESLSAAVARGASVAELAGLFGYHVERPADRYGAIAKRAALARQMFGSAADLPGATFNATYRAAPWGLAIGAVTLLAAGGAAYWLYSRRRRRPA
jgi:hypothetical protein